MNTEIIAERYAEELKSTKALDIELETELLEAAEKQARASHEGWIRGKMAQGYVYGPETNDDISKGPLTNPNLIPYDDLSDETKQSNVANAIAVLKIMRGKEVTFVNFTQVILYPLAKEIHDEWCREKLANGWVWGPVTDKKAKIHRDLVPFDVLLADPDLVGDTTYDVDTARQIIIDLVSKADIFPVISDLSKFKISSAA